MTATQMATTSRCSGMVGESSGRRLTIIFCNDDDLKEGTRRQDGLGVYACFCYCAPHADDEWSLSSFRDVDEDAHG